ncbi:MAG: hypothetical protein ABL995_11735 [Bryobacteraceae bacterium]
MEATVPVTLSPNALALLGYDTKAQDCSAAPLEIREDLLELLLGSAKPVPRVPVTVMLEPVVFQSYSSTFASAPTSAPKREPAPELGHNPELRPIVNAEVPQVNTFRGLNDEASLQRWIESNEKITGLVVSVAVTGDVGPLRVSLIRELAADLLTPEDSAWYTGTGEFLLYCTNQVGVEAQRRLRTITHRLWDLQLRHLNTGVTPFAWGAVEVNDEPIEEAIAAANERMKETLRTRSGFLGSRPQHTAAMAAFGD